MEGLIFNVRRYSIHDGPGIRVTFFMKGCPLSCWWCHNPEGILPEVQEVVMTRRLGEKEFRRTEQAGRFYSVEEIVRVVDEEGIFINQSGGGVTFSGGEPMMQTEFLLEALKACKAKGYHTAVDTSGYSSPENYRSIMPFTDLFLFDLKHIDEEMHIRYTGVSNKMILENLRMILQEGSETYIRIPVIPGINDGKENIEAIRELLLGCTNSNIKRICLLPYHATGGSKYCKFGLEWKMEGVEPPPAGQMDELKTFFSETGIRTKTGG